MYKSKALTARCKCHELGNSSQLGESFVVFGARYITFSKFNVANWSVNQTKQTFEKIQSYSARGKNITAINQ